MVMTRREAALNAMQVRLEGSVPISEIKKELHEFRDKWNLKPHDLGTVLGIPHRTVMDVYYRNGRGQRSVHRDTAKAIRDGMKNYDPRTCIYRRIDKADAAKWVRDVQKKHDCTVAQVARMCNYPESRIRSILCKTSQQKYVNIDVMRTMMINYNQYLRDRERALGI